jgi:translation elongation factor EF-G
MSEMKLQVQIVVPPEFQVDVEKDLERRGGVVRASRTATVIQGEVPADAISEYGQELRSLTKGYGTFTAVPKSG